MSQQSLDVSPHPLIACLSLSHFVCEQMRCSASEHMNTHKLRQRKAKQTQQAHISPKLC